MKKYLEKVKETVESIEMYDKKISSLINERKLKLSMMGVNEVIKILAELIVLESSQQAIQGLVENDDEGIFLMDSNQFENQIPGTKEILDYISLDYIDLLADDCIIIKTFINSIKNQQIKEELLRN